jgi:hypothetical protein
VLRRGATQRTGRDQIHASYDKQIVRRGDVDELRAGGASDDQPLHLEGPAAQFGGELAECVVE